MASYKINGYNVFTDLGILPDRDKTTADSFEAIPDPEPVFSHDWGDGVIEYDLLRPTYFKPRVFTIKGTLFADNQTDLDARKSAISTIIYGNYVTLEHIESGNKVNAKIKDGGMAWKRLTNLDSTKLLVAVQLQFDEVKQAVPFKGINNAVAVYYGPVAVIPATSADVLALPGYQMLSVDNFTLNTGTALTNFVFAIPITKDVVSVTDTTIGVNLNYTPTPITVGGVSYMLYYLTQYVTYLINHPHKIKIKDV